MVSNLWGGWEYGVLCNNGFTFVKEPGFIFFPHGQQAQTLKHQRFAAKSGFIHKATRQGDQRPLWHLPPCGHGLGAGRSRMKTEQQGAWGVGSLGKRWTRCGDRGPRGGPRLRLRARSASFQGHAAAPSGRVSGPPSPNTSAPTRRC